MFWMKCRMTVTVALAFALTGPAWAGLCVKGAAGEYRECKGVCKEDFQIAKDNCINKDHVCVEACREERAECREATGFDAAIDTCNATRETEIANCKVLYDPDTTDRDQCIDNAQLAAFQCRDQVREDLGPAVKACRAAFRLCVSYCPAGAGPVEDPAQCRLDAKTPYKGCRAACREDFQIGKDACRNKDHDCVEQCRTDRQTCKAPVQATFDATVAACAVAKQTAITACNGDDTCIDQAQAVAFQCRDQAREDAKPGFSACRTAFKGCVLVCPPAS